MSVNMLHHVSLPVQNIAKAAQLYDAALEQLGYRQVASARGFVGYGTETGRDKMALIEVASPGEPRPGFHLALSAPSPTAVDGFHRAAIEHGGTDNGAPGLRPHYGHDYYAAFVIDLDGHHIEAVCRSNVKGVESS